MISVILLTCNSAPFLPPLLELLRPFDEVVVLDNGSTDETLSIASSFPNTSLFSHPFIGFGPLRQFATSKARNEWIFSIDSDELPSQELIDALLKGTFDPGTLYSVVRENIYRNKRIRGCGWAHEQIPRFFHRQHTGFCDAKVHEGVKRAFLKEAVLPGVLEHHSYRSVNDFIHKMKIYSDLFVEQKGGRVKGSPWGAFFRGSFAFFKSFILQYGFIDGYRGLLISFSLGATTFYKYLKLYEAQWPDSTSS